MYLKVGDAKTRTKPYGATYTVCSLGKKHYSNGTLDSYGKQGWLLWVCQKIKKHSKDTWLRRWALSPHWPEYRTHASVSLLPRASVEFSAVIAVLIDRFISLATSDSERTRWCGMLRTTGVVHLRRWWNKALLLSPSFSLVYHYCTPGGHPDFCDARDMAFISRLSC